MYELRYYQKEAVEATEREWAAGKTRTLLVLATAAGKTIISSEIIRRRLAAGEKILFLAHRGELLEQAMDKMKKACDIDSVLEKANKTAVGKNCSVVVGSVQTLSNEKRLKRYDKNHFQTIVIDECHHSMSKGYLKVLSYFQSAKVVGVTATPDRGDKKDLGEIYDSIAYEFNIKRGVEEGYLTKPLAQLVPLKLDIRGVNQHNGDYAAGEVGEALDPYLEEIAGEMKTRCAGRKTIVFTPLVKTSVKFVKILKRHGFDAFEVNGNSPDRDQKLQEFIDGKHDVAVNSMLWTEGTDIPNADCAVVLRPTRSRGLYTQMVGRVLRLAEGKKDALILDFLWLTDKHDLCRPASIVAKSEDVLSRVSDKISAAGNEDADGARGAVDILAAAQEAEKEIAAEKEARRKEKERVCNREAALAKQLQELQNNRAKLVDPLQYAVSIGDDSILNYKPKAAWERKAPTDKQIKFLENWGINADSIKTTGKAHAIIESLQQRKKSGLATPKQIRFLEEKGFKKVGLWKMSQASSMIDRIAANRWFVPKDIDAASYNPNH